MIVLLLQHDLLFLLKKKTPSVEKAIAEQRGPNKAIALDSLAKSVATYILSITRNCSDNRKSISPSGIFYYKELKADLRPLLLLLKTSAS